MVMKLNSGVGPLRFEAETDFFENQKIIHTGMQPVIVN